MITLDDAFAKFRSRLELSDKEQTDASKRQTRIRELLRGEFNVERDILTGSYARWTKTKPLKDVDIFFILGDEEEKYHDQHPTVILEAFRKPLATEYGTENVKAARRSVGIDFGVKAVDDDSAGQVMSFDVVPAFSVKDHYEIPDTVMGNWIKTNPEIHKEKGVAANKAFSNEWKPLVKMIKKWNQHKGKPVKPSFLLEVMAFQIFVSPFSGGYPYELKAFMATAEQRIGEVWADPAGLGPAVSDQMDATRVANARKAFQEAEMSISKAIRLSKEGRNGDALQEWRSLFGPLFPLS